MFDQVVRIPRRTIAFTAVCEACAEKGLGPENWLAATVRGTLHVERAHGTVMCARGHVIRIERESLAPAGALA